LIDIWPTKSVPLTTPVADVGERTLYPLATFQVSLAPREATENGVNALRHV
jgi:hypothetical protein